MSKWVKRRKAVGWVLSESLERFIRPFAWFNSPDKGHPMLRLAVWIWIAVLLGTPFGALVWLKSHAPFGITNLYNWGFVLIIFHI
jgi:hypothetical protein